GPGRATGEPLCIQGGRLTPRTPALRTSHPRAWPPPYDRGWHSGQGWAFPGRCPLAAGETAGPGGAPAAKRGRTTWRRGEATAILGREECPHGTPNSAPEVPTSNEPRHNRLTPTAKRTRYA